MHIIVRSINFKLLDHFNYLLFFLCPHISMEDSPKLGGIDS